MGTQEPLIRSSIFDGLKPFVADRQLPIDLTALMHEFKLDPALLGRTDAYVPLGAVTQLFERAALLSGRPCFGLEYAKAYPVGASGSLGFLLTNAPTMREAIDNLVRYLHTFSAPMHIAFEAQSGGIGYVEWMFPIEFTAAMPQYVSFAVGAIIERLRHIAGADWVPLKVDLIHRELACRDLYTAMFGPNVHFDAAYNRLWLDPTTLAMRHSTPNERIYRMALTAADNELAALKRLSKSDAQDIRTRVRAHLRSVLSSGQLELEPVAAGLGMEARQLQYALEQAGTSFSDELSETRRLIAEQLLATTEQSMTEIAAELGFAELSSFTRACRVNWFGMSPSKFRARVRAEGSLSRRGSGSALPDPEDTGA